MLGVPTLREEMQVASSFMVSKRLVNTGATKWALLDSQAVGGKLIQLQFEGVLFKL